MYIEGRHRWVISSIERFFIVSEGIGVHVSVLITSSVHKGIPLYTLTGMSLLQRVPGMSLVQL